MKKTRILSTIILLIHISIVLFAVIGIYLSVTSDNVWVSKSFEMLKFYTILTAIINGLISFISIPFKTASIYRGEDKTPKFLFSLRLLAAVMGFITFIVVVVFLRGVILNSANPTDILFEGSGLFLHFLLPIFSFITFIALDLTPKFKFKNTFIPLIFTTVYGITIIIILFSLQALQGVEAATKFAPYPFFLLTPELVEKYKEIAQMPNYALSYIHHIFMVIGLLLGCYVISFLIWLLNRIVGAIVGYEIKVDNNKNDNKPKDIESKPNSTGPDNKYDKNRVYHISQYKEDSASNERKWKVKLARGEKAIKVFRTQEEAITYAKTLVKSYGGSIRVHSRIGRIRQD